MNEAVLCWGGGREESVTVSGHGRDHGLTPLGSQMDTRNEESDELSERAGTLWRGVLGKRHRERLRGL
jgi:hypothetical protein